MTVDWVPACLEVLLDRDDIRLCCTRLKGLTSVMKTNLLLWVTYVLPAQATIDTDCAQGTLCT